jgi:hypothetical protein
VGGGVEGRRGEAVERRRGGAVERRRGERAKRRWVVGLWGVEGTRGEEGDGVKALESVGGGGDAGRRV